MKTKNRQIRELKAQAQQDAQEIGVLKMQMAALEERLQEHDADVVAAQLLESRDLRSADQRVGHLLDCESKLHLIYRVLSGEKIDANADLLRQIGNRIALNSPTVQTIYERLDGLQRCAVIRDQVRARIADIEPEDLMFKYPDDEVTFREIRDLVL